MHYKNGREAKELDYVVWNDGNNKVIAGRIHSLSAQSQTCNGQIVVPTLGSVQNFYVTLSNCLHADDAWIAAFPEDFHPK